MSNEPRTVEQWLALGEKLPVELAKVYVPKEQWKHAWVWRSRSGGNYEYYCTKCKLEDNRNHGGGSELVIRDKLNREYLPDKPCSVPDPDLIDIKDWNVAMKWFRKIDRSSAWDAMWSVFKLSEYGTSVSMSWWLIFICESKHYLIAAAMAMERSNAELS